jgi:hypothetical protein
LRYDLFVDVGTVGQEAGADLAAIGLFAGKLAVQFATADNPDHHLPRVLTQWIV